MIDISFLGRSPGHHVSHFSITSKRDGEVETWEIQEITGAITANGIKLSIVEVHRPGGQWTYGAGINEYEAAKNGIAAAYSTDRAEEVRG